MLQHDNQLFQELVLSHGFDTPSMPSFELWLKRQGGAVQNLVSFGIVSVQDAALKLLAIYSPGLVTVLAKPCSPAAVKLLAALRSMTVCEIQTNAKLEINALQSSDSLRTLRLQHSNFTADRLPPPLKIVEVKHGWLHAAVNCDCVTSLHSLIVEHGQVFGLHDQGLPAYEKLETLSCIFGLVSPGHSFSR